MLLKIFDSIIIYLALTLGILLLICVILSIMITKARRTTPVNDNIKELI